MACKFIDSFDQYGTAADLIAKWSAANQAGTGIALGTGASGSGQCLTLTNVSGQVWTLRYINHPATTVVSTIVVGFRFKASSRDNGDKTIIYFAEGAITAFHGSLHYTATGEITACRGSGGTTVLATSAAGVLPSNTWVHIECKYTCHDTTGAVIVKVNGVEVINISGVDTRSGGTGLTNIAFFGANTGSHTKSIDDLFILDTSGSVNNDFIGQATVKALLPDGAGASTQWTPSAGSNYQCVDDAAQDGDTTYVASATAGHKDLYTFANLGASDTPKAVEVVALTRKDDATARTMAVTLRSNATDVDGATYTQTTTYDYAELYRDTDPNTSAAWTKAGVDALQAGVKVVS